MSVTVVPAGHFSGQRAIEKNPGGDDTRDLRGLLNEVIAQANTNETNITGLGTPLDYQGAIAAAADFPDPLLVQDGWTYLITADVTDNDATKTNTGDSFKEGDEVVWNGTDWTRLGRKVTEQTMHDYQDTAATSAAQGFMAMAAGKINDVIMAAEVTAGAGEDIVIDVQINGVTCLTSSVTLDATAGTTVQVATVDTTANTLARGDLVTIARTYTAGGTPTPMTDTHVAVGWEEALAT